MVCLLWNQGNEGTIKIIVVEGNRESLDRGQHLGDERAGKGK